MKLCAKVHLCFNKVLLPVVAFIVGLCFFSCRHENKKIDVSKVDVTLKVQRLEDDVMTHENDVAFMQNKYGSFWQLFTYKLVQIGTADSVLLKTRLSDFVHDGD